MSNMTDEEEFASMFNGKHNDPILRYVRNIGGTNIPFDQLDDNDDDNMPQHTTTSFNFKNKQEIENFRLLNTESGCAGFMNLGNTCFMNAALKCLVLSKLGLYFLSNKHKFFLMKNCVKTMEEKIKKKIEKKYREKYPNLDEKVRLKIKKSLIVDILEKKKDGVKNMFDNTLSNAFGDIVKMVHGYRKSENGALIPDNATIKPTNFKRQIAKKCDRFIGYQQHDCEELLNQVLDAIHDELSHKAKIIYDCNLPDSASYLRMLRKRYSRAKDNSNGDQESALKIIKLKESCDEYEKKNKKSVFILESYEFWKTHVKNDYSIITRLFKGMCSSEIVCHECKNSSVTFDTFINFSLPISDIKDNTLDSCFAKYCEGEVLDGDNKYKCSKCNEKRDATKTMFLWNTPEIFIVHLKRFSNNRQKINSHIDYPIKGLKLNNYKSSFNQTSEVYDLYAVANHMGSFHGGHYTAYCKNHLNNKWYEHNDSMVTYIPENDVKNKVVSNNGYILFYERRN